MHCNQQCFGKNVAQKYSNVIELAMIWLKASQKLWLFRQTSGHDTQQLSKRCTKEISKYDNQFRIFCGSLSPCQNIEYSKARIQRLDSFVYMYETIQCCKNTRTIKTYRRNICTIVIRLYFRSCFRPVSVLSEIYSCFI